MRTEWSVEDLVASWTLVEEDWRLIGNNSGPMRLGFAVLLKFFELEAAFPASAAEVPDPAMRYLAEQVHVDGAQFARYRWTGRTVEYHRAQIRAAFGFREACRAASSPPWAASPASATSPVERLGRRSSPW